MFQVCLILFAFFPEAIFSQSFTKDIKVGLELAIADGSFEKLFQQNFAEVIQLANLNKRRLFHITNSLITDLEYLNRSELWFSPSTIDVQHNQ